MAADAKGESLESLRWKNRVLVVIAPSAQDDSLLAQRRIVQQNAPGMTERQIVVIEAVGDGDRAQSLRKKFSVQDRQFKVLLLGKDGNTALSSATPIDAVKLFGTIDAMPMRQDEMKRQRK